MHDCWPTQADWAALNSTIDGHLIQGKPPASVCYPNEPNYDHTACQDVLKSWTSSAWHAADPVSVDAPDVQHGCFPIYENGTDTLGNALAGVQGCASWAYPTYVVNATKEEYVQAGVRFVRKHNLRLNVKGTGHGGQHSQTAGSLSIWTYHLQDIEFIEDFQPAGSNNKSSSSSSTGHLAMRFGAGMQDRTAFEAAALHDVVVVGGTDSTVGLAGWATGGGHGYLTAVHGQGADNILEARIVTAATGDLVVANEFQHSDLLWGLRGGGHGLAGIITSLTMKAYPMPNTTFWSLSVSQNTNNQSHASSSSSSPQWWTTVARILSDLPRLKEAGLLGYATLGGSGSPSSPFRFTNAGFAYNAANGSIDPAISPLLSWLAEQNASVSTTSSLTFKEKWIEVYHLFNLTQAVGGGEGAVTSRLLPASSVVGEENEAALAETLAKIAVRDRKDGSTISSPSISGTWTLSPVADNCSSLSSAWRNAILHLRVGKSWTGATPPAEAERVTKSLTENTGYALRQLAPDAGAYFNEADANEPNWQFSLFGENYARLRAVKEKYDPEGLQ